ncbi:MAG: HWE histidine kinase domain-containing protein [Propylenella sp.]
MPAIVLLAGLALTASAAWFADLYLSRAEVAQSARRIESASSAVRLALDRVATAVRAVRAMYAADVVTSDQFVRFARTLTRTQPIRSLGFYRRVEGDTRASYERRFSAEPAATLGIWERDAAGEPVRARDRPVYFIVESGFFADGTEPSFGLDVAASPERAADIKEALQRFELVASDVIPFPSGHGTGVLLYDPVLDRNGTVVGVATASLTFRELALTASRVSGVSGISISVGAPASTSELEKEDKLAADERSRAFNLGGHSWKVAVAEDLTETSIRGWVLALIVGLGLATTIAILAFLLSAQKTKEVTLARTRLRAMLDGLGPLAWLLTPDGTIVNSNRAVTAAFGRPESDIVGRPFWEFLADGRGDMGTERIRAAISDAAKGEDARFDLSIGDDDDRRVFDLWIRCKELTSNLVASAVDVTARYESEQAQRLLMRELDHRIKNTLQVIQAVIRRTAKAQSTIEGFERSLLGRVGAMSRAHELLAEERWQGANLSTLVGQETQSFDAGGNAIRAAGPRLRLNPKAALAIALAMHELGTNASKYGALSSPQGVVDVSWFIDRAGAEPALTLRWQESQGPEVKEPDHRGFGSMLIERSIAYELDGNAIVEFRKEGLVCTIAVPLRTITPFAAEGPERPLAAAAE